MPSPRRGITVVLTLSGAALAVAAGVGLDRAVVPALSDEDGPPAGSKVIAQADPEARDTVTGSPEAGRRQPAAPPEEALPPAKPLRGASPDNGTNGRPSTPPGGSGGGGGGQSGTPTGASGPEGSVVQLTNKERAKAGCGPLRVDQRLVTAARRHSADMAAQNYFDHTSKNGDSPWRRMEKAGYPSPGAENIAKGYGSAASVMAGWMNSPGHRANILNCKLKAIGVGMQAGSGGPWWTQDFGWA